MAVENAEQALAAIDKQVPWKFRDLVCTCYRQADDRDQHKCTHCKKWRRYKLLKCIHCGDKYLSDFNCKCTGEEPVSPEPREVRSNVLDGFDIDL